jgi:hypothetical protein
MPGFQSCVAHRFFLVLRKFTRDLHFWKSASGELKFLPSQPIETAEQASIAA